MPHVVKEACQQDYQEEMRLVIEGQPVAAPRPRVTRMGRAYLPKHYTDYKKSAITQLRNQNTKHPLTDDTCIHVEYVFKRLANTPKRQVRRIYKSKKPDIDNCIKSTLDCLVDAGVLLDDNIVVSISAVKYMAALGEEPHTTINIRGIDEIHEGESKGEAEEESPHENQSSS